jgi:hypothetical protein
MKNKSMDELCELAHKELVKECKKLNITVDQKENEHGEVFYTDQAQTIFNNILDNLDNKYNL